MRKILIVVFALLIPVFACISVSAYGVDNPDSSFTDRVYAPIQFDLVKDKNGEYTWPYDSCLSDADNDPFSFCDGLMEGSISFDQPQGYVNGTFLLPGAGNYDATNPETVSFLNEELQVIDARNLTSFEIQAREGLDIRKVTISFSVVEPVIGHRLTDATKEAWQFTTYELEGVFYASTQENMQIGNWIASMIRDSSVAESPNYTMLFNLKIDVEITRTLSTTPGFDVRYLGLENEPAADIVNWAWVRQMNRDVEVIDPASVGWFDWLLDSVDAFMSLEIAPGFSIRIVVHFVIVVGILVAFLKIMG